MTLFESVLQRSGCVLRLSIVHSPCPYVCHTLSDQRAVTERRPQLVAGTTRVSSTRAVDLKHVRYAWPGYSLERDQGVVAAVLEFNFECVRTQTGGEPRSGMILFRRWTRRVPRCDCHGRGRRGFSLVILAYIMSGIVASRPRTP